MTILDDMLFQSCRSNLFGASCFGWGLTIAGVLVTGSVLLACTAPKERVYLRHYFTGLSLSTGVALLLMSITLAGLTYAIATAIIEICPSNRWTFEYYNLPRTSYTIVFECSSQVVGNVVLGLETLVAVGFLSHWAWRRYLTEWLKSIHFNRSLHEHHL